MRTLLWPVLAMCALVVSPTSAFAQQIADPWAEAPLAALGTAFTYQGQLFDGGSPANDSYDFQLRLFNALTSGSQIGSTIVKDNVGVAGGVFTVELDFSESVFTGQALWLEIGVRPGSSTGTFTTLSPRQPLGPAPFAHYSKAGVATDVQCTGCVGIADLAGGTATSGHVLTATGGSTMAWQSPAGVTGTGSGGQVAFWSGSSTLSGSSNLYWNNANGRLGLGTASPSQQLTLTGNLALPFTTATVGQITLGGYPFVHAYGASNTFLGVAAGNVTLTGSGNSASGESALAALTSGSDNTGMGYGALYMDTSGPGNSAFGSRALRSNSTGTFNTAVGYASLYSNTTAGHNTVVGVGALFTQDFDNSGTPWDADNTAVGFEAMNKNKPTSTSNGANNTAVGSHALYSNTVGTNNTAVGVRSLSSNTTGLGNTAIGQESLRFNVDGAFNVAVGGQALWGNGGGSANVAVGNASMRFNTTASWNTAVGNMALDVQSFYNGGVAWESDNTAVGGRALLSNQPTSTSNGRDNTAVGANSLTHNTVGFANTAIGTNAMQDNDSGSWNVAIGMNALKDNNGNGNVAIGNDAGAGYNGTNQLFIGTGLGTLIWGDFYNQRVAIGMTNGSYQLQLATDSAGKPNGGSWANSSDARLKRDIVPLSGALDKLLGLEGVSFEWVNPAEHGGWAQSAGFIAQDVERVFPEWVSFIDPIGADRALVAPGEKVRSLTLPFAFDAYLVEAIREQQKEIETQRALIKELLERVAALEGQPRERTR